MFRTFAIVSFAATSISLLGCVQIYDSIDERIIECRQKNVANKAWNRHADYWQNEIHNKDFEKGFRAGYYAVMQGKGTRPPTLPPRKYWSACNMKEDCKQRTLAWFNGYSSGANVAIGDGVENFCRITTAEELYRKPSTHVSTEWNDQQINPIPQIQPAPLKPLTPLPKQDSPVPNQAPMSPPAPEGDIPPAPVIERISHTRSMAPATKTITKHSNYIQTLDLFEVDTKIKKMSYQKNQASSSTTPEKSSN